ncbi:MAG TPA: D-2-hydroxyacid dehydrogenase, partial [Acidobacteriota bacterium]|nr:D-2-hydroxyacid dehydrogenase [Acidobacteriota bacterium]
RRGRPDGRPRRTSGNDLMTRERERKVVTCTFSRHAEFIGWLRKHVAADRLLARRIELLLPETREAIPAALPRTQILATIMLSPDDYARAPHLEWVQLGLAGADSAMFPAIRESRVKVTTAVGTHDETVPYAAWSFVLAFATGLHEGYRQKSARIWDRKAIVLQRRPLSGQTLLIVGTGRIGTGIARLGKQAGMRVWGVRRRSGRSRPPHFDRIVTARGLDGALAQADYVVLIVPGGEATHHLIGAAQFRRMKRSAYLINVARGSVVDEKALIAALQSGRIAGAGLDVFAAEPLPADHPFYTLPNVAMTPHTSGDTADYSYRAAEVFLMNLKRYLSGRPLVNLVDKQRGY